MSKLNAARLKEIFNELLFTQAEVEADPDSVKERAIKVSGIMNNFGLNPDRIEQHREEILAMLRELPDEFMAHGGGGWSFLNACMDRHGNQWADMHQTMELLVVAGIAAGYVKFMFEDRKMWSMFPGGMPYFAVTDPDAPKPQPTTADEPS